MQQIRDERRQRQGRIVRNGMARLGIIVAWFLAMTATSGAEVILALPGGGAYHVGRYMAVELSGAGDGDEVIIEGEGVLGTRVPWGAGREGRLLVPILVTGPQVNGLRVRDGAAYDGRLRVMAAGEWLVATGGQVPDEIIAADGVATVERVAIEELLARPQPAEAWAGLDAVVLEEAEYAALPRRTIDVLTAAGCVVAVRAAAPPDGRAWVARGAWQVLERQVLGPRGVVMDESAYAPMQAWVPGWSGTTRRQLWVAGLGVGVIAMVASFRRRWAVGGVILAAVVGIAGVSAWQAVTPPVFAAMGQVNVRDAIDASGPVQQDVWAYQTAARETTGAYWVRGLTWPVFAGRMHADAVRMELRCAADGSPVAWIYHLKARGAVAFVSRSWQAHREAPDRAAASERTATEALAWPMYGVSLANNEGRSDAGGELGQITLRRP